MSFITNPEHPWVGLYPFTEGDQDYFFGRTAELREILLRVRENPLTILYGQSGLGKTSLLRAGLMPELSAESYRPVRLLLDFDPNSPTLVQQVRTALAEMLTGGDADVAQALLALWAPLQSLWEIFAHEALRPPDLAEVPPVLIFDQFEEVFTLGENDAPARHPRRGEVAELFGQLADVVENRVPAALERKMAEEPRLAHAFDLTPCPVRIVLTLRDEYLAQIEDWKHTMPSLMRNRMPLRLLNGVQALEAVVRPGRMDGRNLVSDEVGAQIVRFVAQRETETPLEEIEGVPPLISLFCERLNRARLAARPPQDEITAKLVAKQGKNILQSFYDETFAAFTAVPREEIREWVETPGILVTSDGHRTPVAREDAVAELARRGVKTPEAVLDTLIERRLLTAERRGGTQRLEITHDVLCPLIVRARKQRESQRTKAEVKVAQKEAAAQAVAERNRLWRTRGMVLSFTVLGLLLLGALLFAVDTGRRAEREASRAREARQEAGKQRQEAANQRQEMSDRVAGAEKRAAEMAREKALSDAARDRAVVARDAAEELITFAHREVRDAQRAADSSNAYENISKRIRQYRSENPTVESRMEDLSNQTAALTGQGDALRAKGDLAGALASYRSSLTAAEALAREQPENPTGQRALLVASMKVGDALLDYGDAHDALRRYRAGFAMAEALAKKDPGNIDAQRDLLTAYDKMGRVLRDVGDVPGALQNFLAGLAISNEIATQQPENDQWRREVSVGYENVGSALLSQGEPAEALLSFRISTSIREALATSVPSHSGRQRDLAAGYEKMGDALRAQGDLPGATERYQASAVIRETLVKKDSANVEWQRELAVATSRLAEVLETQEKLPEALQSYQRSLAILEKLAALNPADVMARRVVDRQRGNVDRLRVLVKPAKKKK